MSTPAEFMANGNDELTGEVVPFGKYRGRPVAELAADDGYRDWVLAQPWVRERYGNFYQILVQGAPPSQDSPEHNEMQARFLDEDWCLRLAACLPELASHGLGDAIDQVTAWQAKNSGVRDEYEVRPASATNIDFEHGGWDIFFNYQPKTIVQHWSCECPIQYDGIVPPADSWDRPRWKENWRKNYNKPCAPQKPPDYLLSALGSLEYSKRLAEYETKLEKYEAELAEYPPMRHFALDHGDHENIFELQRLPGRQLGHGWIEIAAELKPDLGDDYPAVLRQVKGHLTQRMQVPYSHGQYTDVLTCDVAFTVARRAQFRSVTWEQVRRVFAASGVILIRESDISGNT